MCQVPTSRGKAANNLDQFSRPPPSHTPPFPRHGTGMDGVQSGELARCAAPHFKPEGKCPGKRSWRKAR